MDPRELLLDSPAGDTLLVRSMTGHEELGRLFEYQLELLTLTPLQGSQLLGLPMTVKSSLPDDQIRYFHGYTTELALTGGQGRYLRYEATLRPWLWFLTRSSNCRIFQQKTVPEVLKQVFRDHGFSDFVDSLSDNYRTWEYLAQYCESDFDFVSRLMEQEGIYYYFKHEATRHTLVLADGYSAHKPIAGGPEVGYFVPDKHAARERDYFDRWQSTQAVVSGAYVIDDYDFKRPNAELKVKLRAPQKHARSDYEQYSYPGEYVQTGEGESQVRVRLQELQAQAELVRAAGVVRAIAAGGLFKLTSFPHPEQNREYLVVSAHYTLHAGEWESGPAAGAEAPFRCEITAIQSRAQFRPERRTPRPLIAGHQTAKVVGKQGQEIWTDEHGRVKVQFPWDREGKADENSSCWIRVSQAWAGNGFGSIHVPRIGQEVLVSFLEGDPDRPIITGRVYNAMRKPPYALPSKAMVSGVKTESTLGGGGYNELAMDDSKGAEQITLHAQRDMGWTVEQDLTVTVHHDRTTTVDHDDTEHVGHNQSVSVDGDATLKVLGANEVTVVGNFKLTAAEAEPKCAASSIHIAPAEIELKCGPSSIRITPAGVFISGPIVGINS